MRLTIIPSGESLIIEAIYNEDNKHIPYARPEDSVCILLKGIGEEYVKKGDIICSNHSFAYVCSEIECEIDMLDLLEHKPILASGYTCMIHLHAAVKEVCIKSIQGINNW